MVYLLRSDGANGINMGNVCNRRVGKLPLCSVHRGSFPGENSNMYKWLKFKGVKSIVRGHKLCIYTNDMLYFFCSFSIHLQYRQKGFPIVMP